MASRQRGFPDDSDRFQYFEPDDGGQCARYAALNPAHDPDVFAQAFRIRQRLGKAGHRQARFPTEARVDTRGVDELMPIFFEEDGGLRTNGNRLVQLANAEQISIGARLGQIEHNSEWHARRLRHGADFAPLPRTLAKTLGELLVAPADWVRFDRGDDMETVAQALVIDPRLITRTLLENLGLKDPVTQKGLLQEDQLALRATMIPEIKAVLSRLEPIRRPDEVHETLGDLRYFRLMRVKGGPHDGEVVGTQTVQGQKILFRTDLRGAERRLAHIHFGYKEEVEKLTFIHRTIEALWNAFEAWNAPANEQALASLFETMVTLVKSLAHVQDEDKRELLKQLKECQNPKDSRGRSNPAAKQARLATAGRFVGGRLRTIERVSKHLGEDHAKVIQVVAAQQDPLTLVRKRMDSRDPWDQQFAEFRRVAPRVKYEPDLSFAREARDHVVSINRKLNSREAQEKDAARKEYVDLYVLCKLKEAYDGVWEVYRRISLAPHQEDPRRLMEELKGIEGRLKDKSFAESTETHAYEPAYVEMYHLLNSLKKRLRELLSIPETTPQEVEAANHDLQQLLKGIQGKSPLLDRLLESVTRNPQLNLFKLEDDVDPDAKRATFGRMKQRIAEVDFRALLAAEATPQEGV